MCELVSGCHLSISWLPKIVLNPLKSNWHLAASCQLPFHKFVHIGIWLPFAGFLNTLNCLKSSEIELAFGCQLPIHMNIGIGFWLPFADFLFTENCLNFSQIELAPGCQLPDANLQECANWHLAAICRFLIYLKLSYPLKSNKYLATLNCLKSSEIELASGCQLPVANSHEYRN